MALSRAGWWRPSAARIPAYAVMGCGTAHQGESPELPCGEQPQGPGAASPTPFPCQGSPGCWQGREPGHTGEPWGEGAHKPARNPEHHSGPTAFGGHEPGSRGPRMCPTHHCPAVPDPALGAGGLWEQHNVLTLYRVAGHRVSPGFRPPGVPSLQLPAILRGKPRVSAGLASAPARHVLLPCHTSELSYRPHPLVALLAL